MSERNNEQRAQELVDVLSFYKQAQNALLQESAQLMESYRGVLKAEKIEQIQRGLRAISRHE